MLLHYSSIATKGYGCNRVAANSLLTTRSVVAQTISAAIRSPAPAIWWSGDRRDGRRELPHHFSAAYRRSDEPSARNHKPVLRPSFETATERPPQRLWIYLRPHP